MKPRNNKDRTIKCVACGRKVKWNSLHKCRGNIK